MPMDPVEAQHTRGNDGGKPEVRVILVGRTGLDARLRLDPDVELVRVRTRLEAVGELSDACHEGMTGRAVVIVGAEAGSNGEARPGEFVQALRRLDPSVRVLGVGEGASAEFDGALATDAAPDAMRRALRGAGQAPESGERPVVTATVKPEESLLESLAPAARRARAPETGDEILVRLLMSGRDVTEAAVELIRRRLGRPDAVFVPGESPDGAGAAVIWRGRVFGTLRTAGASEDELARHAVWLGGWLALRDQHGQLQEAAFKDQLTGAFNRRYCDHFLGTILKEARHERRAVTVLVFDVDDLKTFNDRYGHAAGDQILREAVRLLESVIRPTDRVCRIGGDEFAVIFHEPHGPRRPASTPPKTVFEIAERFQREICDRRFPKLGSDAPGRLTVSGGLATYPWDGQTAEELLARADQLALQCKREGKNAIRFGPGSADVCGPGRG